MDEKNRLPRVRFEVDDTKQHENGFTVYRICLETFFQQYPNSVIIVWRRYQQIRLLYEQLQKSHPELTFPEFPKKITTGRFRPEVIEERRKQFKKFFDAIANQPLLYESTELLAFLEEKDAEEDAIESIRAFALGRTYDRIDLKPLLSQTRDKSMLFIHLGSSDPHPLLILAYRLQRAGLKVKVATLAQFKKIVSSYSLDCVLISGFVDVEALKKETSFQSFVVNGDSPTNSTGSGPDDELSLKQRVALTLSQASKWLFTASPLPSGNSSPVRPASPQHQDISQLEDEFTRISNSLEMPPSPTTPTPKLVVQTADGHDLSAAALAASISEEPLALSMLQLIAPRVRTRKVPNRLHPQQLDELMQASASINADAIVCSQGLPELGALFCLSEVNGKRVYCLLQDPIHPTKLFPHSSVYVRRQLSFMNSYSYAECELVDWLLLRRVVNFWLKGKRGLGSSSVNENKALTPLSLNYWLSWLRGTASSPPILSSLYCVSPSVFDRPSDWPATPCADICGFVFPEDSSAEREGKTTIPSLASFPQNLVAFLNQGPKPVFIGLDVDTLQLFSSNMQTHILGVIVEALQDANMRCILCIRTVADDIPADLLSLVQTCVGHTTAIHLLTVNGAVFPYLWLFRNCAAIVHDGSSELLANSLRSGLPMLILSTSSESIFWADQVEQLGISVKPIPIAYLNPKTLYSALRIITTDRDMQVAADALGEHVRAESGPERALVRILTDLEQQQTTQ